MSTGFVVPICQLLRLPRSLITQLHHVSGAGIFKISNEAACPVLAPWVRKNLHGPNVLSQIRSRIGVERRLRFQGFVGQ